MSKQRDTNWFSSLRWRPSADGLRRKRRPRLHVELLEDRCLLATITVTSLVDGSGPGQVTLPDAIQAANTNTSVNGSTAGDPGADTIRFAPGLMGTFMLGGQLTISEPLTIQGSGITIDGGPGIRIFDITDTAGDVTLDNLILEGGVTLGNRDPQNPFTNHGGAIYCASPGTLTISNCTLSKNHTLGIGVGGGAIFIHDGTLTIVDSILSGNSAAGRGGAIYCGHAAVTVTGSTISQNQSGVTSPMTPPVNATGGGIFSAYGPVTVTDSTVDHNSTAFAGAKGGGIFVRGGNPTYPTALTITNSTISNNFTQAGDSPGGGICAINDTPITVNNSTIWGNAVQGGATGGGIYDGGGPLTLRSSIVAGNSADGYFPDLYFDSNSPYTITNSLVGNNGGFLALSPGTGLTPNSAGNLFGTPSGPLNPMLGPLQDNGGPTATQALLPGSPAIDRGSNPLNLTTDQRGLLRVFGAQPDMGAYESQPTTLVVTSAADRLDTVFDIANLTLRDALAVANSRSGPDTITFAPGLNHTAIVLSLGQLEITDAVTVDGQGPANTIIDAQQLSRVLDVAAGAGDVTLADLNLTDGLTTNESGGGVSFLSSGTLTVNDCTIIGNTSAGHGGGIYSPLGAIILTNSTVSNNSLEDPYGDGGGIYVNLGGISLTNSTVSGNSAGYFGGGISAIGGVVQLTGSTLSGNSAGVSGGGLAMGTGTVALTNCTVSGNTAGFYGGGLLVSGGNTEDLTVTNSTVTLNEASQGGGIGSGGGLNLVLNSSIVAGNRVSSTSPGPDLAKALSIVAHQSLIGSNSGTSLAASGPIPDANGNLIGSATSPIDPLLGPLAHNGGPTLTHALQTGSPAIDRGANPLNLATDQRGAGFARQVGAAVDMGAVESGALGPPHPPPPPPGQIVKQLPKPPIPIRVVLTTQQVNPRAKTRRLVAQVQYSNRGVQTLVSPFQTPIYRSIAALLMDLNGDGVADAVVFTARNARSGKKARRLVPL